MTRTIAATVPARLSPAARVSKSPGNSLKQGARAAGFAGGPVLRLRQGIVAVLCGSGRDKIAGWDWGVGGIAGMAGMTGKIALAVTAIALTGVVPVHAQQAPQRAAPQAGAPANPLAAAPVQGAPTGPA